jgi:hypothetical protein
MVNKIFKDLVGAGVITVTTTREECHGCGQGSGQEECGEDDT